MQVAADDSLDVSTCTPDERQRLLDGMYATGAALHLEQLRVIKAVDDAEDWHGDGMLSMSDWLAYHYRLSDSTARAWRKAAHALAEMPLLAEVYASGRVSFDQVRIALSFAEPADDAWLATELPGLSARAIAALADQRRRVTKREQNEADRTANLRFTPHSSGLGKRVSGFLPTELAATVEESLTTRADEMGPDPETGQWAPFERRMAHALHEQCDDDLSERNRTGGGDAHVVVVHTPAATLAGHEDAGSATIDGQPIHDDTLQRIACDASIEHHVDTPDGRTVGIGRASKVPPRWLRRRVKGRDGGVCRWPGCCRPIRHLHHMKQWSRDGGPTDASNLLGVCWHHHHLLHEGGWEATGNADTDVTFVSPWGRELRSRAGPVAA